MNVQDLDTVSLDRVIGDRVPVEPVEAYAVLQFVWERLRASRDSDGRMMPLPALERAGHQRHRRHRHDAARG